MALIAILVALGSWQMRRAVEQRALGEQLATSATLPFLTSPVENRVAPQYLFRRLRLEGQYLSSRQFLLEAMTYRGEAGYHVLTPFRPKDSERWLLVNRGWVKADPDRRILPDVAVSEASRPAAGRIAFLPRPGIRLGSPPSNAALAGTEVMLFPTAEELAARFARPLFSYQLLLDAEEPDGFVRDWQPRALAAERHWGYALQWFALALVLTALAVRMAWQSRRRTGA